ncbi:McrB family protein [Pedobacter glucosidilyticus]|uniref:McrB family protein n=1 Tax=Pedobacter glucosidilyticus TaxID=1122941 RepID=UPI0004002B7D|nr:AAA family ATPase [Pedobacter glucosidilyticus]
MPDLAKQFTKEQIEAALEYIIENKPILSPSTQYNLVYKGKEFPPKEVIRVAAKLFQIPKWETMTLNGGDNTNLPLIEIGFTINKKNHDVFAGLIKQYKELLNKTGLKEEVYKWELVQKFKGRPNLNVPDFNEEIRGIDFSNLVYGVGIGCIRHLAIAKTEEYRECFKILFDEKIDLADRMARFSSEVLTLYRSIVPDPKLSSHHDERTIATLLTLHKPEKYAFFKDSFYQELCKRLKIKPANKGEKYIHYLSIIDDFVNGYIKPDTELLNLVKLGLTKNSYEDPNHLILVQDILYRMLDKYTRTFSSLLEELNDELKVENEGSTFQLLMSTQGKDRKRAWIWISDKENLITDTIAHYELVYNLNEGTLELFLHFEDESNCEIFYNEIGETLPSELKWFKWFFKSKSIKYGVVIDFFSQSTVSKIIDGLNYMDGSIGNKIREIVMRLNMEKNGKSNFKSQPLNQILYGPPGTGKTYHTINKALSIIEGKEERDLAKEERSEIKSRFDIYVNSGQIVFITFHQSMGYEDFVEGIKPDIEEDKDGVRSVVYEKKDGIFKKLCNKARILPIEYTDGKKYYFEDAWNELIAQVQNYQEMEVDYVLNVLTPNKGLKITDITNSGNLRLTPKGSTGKEYTVSFKRLKILQNAIPDLTKIKNIDKEFRAIIGGMNSTAYWATLNFINNWLEKANGNRILKEPIEKAKPHVLIIDEINRGNVSQIFGELITLIENDKRAEEEEALEIILPYSHEKFSVPNNVYIIGTMNTADRSVEALDTALRRRFCFEEMLPNHEHNLIGIVDGIHLGDVLKKINKRLEKLLSRDHTIGHSFFINVNDEEKLYHVFYDKIIPLLQEYFFGDYGKIGLVLGSAFVKGISKKDSYENFFASFEYEDKEMLFEKKVYKIEKFENDIDYSNFLNAVKNI